MIRFRVEGTPRADVRVNVPGMVRGLALREVSPGVYAGRYTIRHDDELDRLDEARFVLRSGDRRVVVRADEVRERYGYGYGR